MAPTLGGCTQDTDFNKGFTKGSFTKNLRRRNGGGQGDPDPLIKDPQREAIQRVTVMRKRIDGQKSSPLIGPLKSSI